MTVFTPIPHEAFVADVRALAALLARDAWKPDYIVGVGRGGLVPAVFLSHATGLPSLSVDWSSQVRDFAGAALERLAVRTLDRAHKGGERGGERGGEPGGERLLFVDDINDTGRTIGHLRETLARAGAAPRRVRFATLLDNVRSAQRVEYRARTIDRAVTKDWFVFPWEAIAPPMSLADDAAAVPERIA